jgi:hypothetical protein
MIGGSSAILLDEVGPQRHSPGLRGLEGLELREIRMVTRRTLIRRTRDTPPSDRMMSGSRGRADCRFTDQDPQAIVFHTDANDEVDPPLGSTITVTHSKDNSLGKLLFVDLNSKVLINGVERPFDRR